MAARPLVVGARRGATAVAGPKGRAAAVCRKPSTSHLFSISAYHHSNGRSVFRPIFEFAAVLAPF